MAGPLPAHNHTRIHTITPGESNQPSTSRAIYGSKASGIRRQEQSLDSKVQKKLWQLEWPAWPNGRSPGFSGALITTGSDLRTSKIWLPSSRTLSCSEHGQLGARLVRQRPQQRRLPVPSHVPPHQPRRRLHLPQLRRPVPRVPLAMRASRRGGERRPVEHLRRFA